MRRNGHPDRVLPNTLNLEIAGISGETLLQALDLEGVSASAGAACHAGAITPSHVLSAMHRTPREAESSLRLSVGLGVDEDQIDHVVARVVDVVGRASRAEAS